jgi:hypothetical protein
MTRLIQLTGLGMLMLISISLVAASGSNFRAIRLFVHYEFGRMTRILKGYFLASPG